MLTGRHEEWESRCVILPVVYFALVLALCWRYRRRTVGIAVLLCAALPVYGFTTVLAYVNRDPSLASNSTGIVAFLWTNVADNVGRMFHVFSFAYLLVLWLCGGMMWRGHRMIDHRIPCHHCGYDLRGNLAGACPECGEPILPEVRSKIQDDLRAHQDDPHASLPVVDSDEQAERAGKLRRRITLPAHLRHDHTDPELLTRGASRARPHGD